MIRKEHIFSPIKDWARRINLWSQYLWIWILNMPIEKAWKNLGLILKIFINWTMKIWIKWLKVVIMRAQILQPPTTRTWRMWLRALLIHWRRLSCQHGAMAFVISLETWSSTRNRWNNIILKVSLRIHYRWRILCSITSQEMTIQTIHFKFKGLISQSRSSLEES